MTTLYNRRIPRELPICIIYTDVCEWEEGNDRESLT